jgi:hypothetical protein
MINRIDIHYDFSFPYKYHNSKTFQFKFSILDSFPMKFLQFSAFGNKWSYTDRLKSLRYIHSGLQALPFSIALMSTIRPEDTQLIVALCIIRIVFSRRLG